MSQSSAANIGGGEFINVSCGSSTNFNGPISVGYAAHTSTPTETVEWAKFAMWLRGFLSALEGKEFTTEDRDKIMEKLSSVDPDSQGWRYSELVKPLPQPYQAPPTWAPMPTPSAPYVVPDTTTTWKESLEKLKVFCDNRDNSNGG